MKNHNYIKRTLFLTILIFFWCHSNSQNQNNFKESNKGLWDAYYGLALKKSNDNFIYVTDLQQEFRQNAFIADAKYKGKIISVSGTVFRVAKDNYGRYFVDLSNVIIYFKPSETSSLGNLSAYKPTIITGTCIGKEKDDKVYIIDAQINYKELQKLDEYVQREIEIVLLKREEEKIESKRRSLIAEEQRIAEEKRKEEEQRKAEEQRRFSFDLPGRTLLGKMDFYIFHDREEEREEGTIVINITVGPDGNVFFTSIGRGTNIKSRDLRRRALSCAGTSRFNKISGKNNQSGTITYNLFERSFK